MAQGETKEAIVASLEERFGEQVLGAPKNEGFGRAAWLGPIVISLIGLAIVWVFLRRFLARREEAPEAAADEAPAPDPAVRQRIEEELERHHM